MKAQATKTARFSAVVERSGKPEAAFLWTKPQQDRHFMTAARQNRVMTVKQETVGTKKDFGLVGFLEEKNVSYLIFPKSLSPFKDHKIGGIKYDKVQPSKPLGRVVQPSDSEAPRSKRIRTTADLRPTLR